MVEIMSSGPRASSALMSALEARGPEDDETMD
jgi:hypothetical protein